MPHDGFAIDLRKCIGCHACTIARKAEHDIPIGVNRCWVKTVEKGTFPDTRRFFFPVLCNQCDEAPCARICPTRALFRRRHGDLHGFDPDGALGIRQYFESPGRPGEPITVDEYYGWMFERSVPGLPETASREGLTPLQAHAQVRRLQGERRDAISGGGVSRKSLAGRAAAPRL